MEDPPNSYHICSCCGTEFGNDDADMSCAELREQWIAKGCVFFFPSDMPSDWNHIEQLKRHVH